MVFHRQRFQKNTDEPANPVKAGIADRWLQ
jgi:hypothetical protein